MKTFHIDLVKDDIVDLLDDAAIAKEAKDYLKREGCRRINGDIRG